MLIVEDLKTKYISESSTTEQQKTGSSRVILDLIETLLLSFVLFVGINLVTTRIRVDGSSMEPNLHHGEFVLVNRLAFKWSKPQRGDVIIFRFPRNPSQEYIKRVIGLPSDEVYIANKQVFINGQLLEESYIADAPQYHGTWIVPDNSLFVLGDNRNYSSDSHDWEFVPMQNVIGKALIVYWPPQDWGKIRHTAQ